jgi:hypothetical protein
LNICAAEGSLASNRIDVSIIATYSMCICAYSYHVSLLVNHEKNPTDKAYYPCHPTKLNNITHFQHVESIKLSSFYLPRVSCIEIEQPYIYYCAFWLSFCKSCDYSNRLDNHSIYNITVFMPINTYWYWQHLDHHPLPGICCFHLHQSKTSRYLQFTESCFL